MWWMATPTPVSMNAPQTVWLAMLTNSVVRSEEKAIQFPTPLPRGISYIASA